MRIEGDLVEAHFVGRPNRFVVVAEVDGAKVRAHCPNPGRLTELLVPENPFLLRRVPARTVAAADRRTAFDVVAARHRDAWVVLDTRLANEVVADALADGCLDDAFPPACAAFTREPAHGDGRLDFAVETAGEGDGAGDGAGDGPGDGPDDGPDDGDPVLVEVKSVTLLDETDGETGLFPDAPTARGTRHLRELTRVAQGGGRAAVLFVAMRPDVGRVRPHRERDPDFAEALRSAADAGVALHGYRTRFDPAAGRFALADPVPVEA